MIDVAALVGDIPTTAIMVRTFAAPTINAYGEPVAESTDADAIAVVHPADRRTRERLPSVDRPRELISIYLTTAIDTVRTAQAPRVLYAGRWYEIVEIQDYLALGGIVIATGALIDEVAP